MIGPGEIFQINLKKFIKTMFVGKKKFVKKSKRKFLPKHVKS